MRLIHMLLFGCVLMPGAAARADEPTGWGVTQRSSTWLTNLTEDDRVPGIDEGAFVFMTLKSGQPKGMTVIFWSDVTQGFSGRGEGRVDRAHYRGEQQLKDGSVIKYVAETEDGETGTVTIGEKEYDIAKGPLFLVSGRGNKPDVLQLPLDEKKLSNFRGGYEKIMQLGLDDERILKFWKKDRGELSD